MIRKKRGKGLKLHKIIYLLLPVLFVIIFLLIARSNFFSIKHIDVQGDKINCVDNDQLKKDSGLYGKNFFTLNKQKSQEDLKIKFICIKNVIVGRIIPDKVKLEVLSRKPSAVLLSLRDKEASQSSLIENIATPGALANQDRYIVDSEGVVFSKNIDDADIPKIYMHDSEIAVGKILKNISINNSLKILDKIKTFGVTAKKSWIVEDFFIINPDTYDPKIIFRLNHQIDIELASLQLILTEAKIDLRELTFIDLRFDKPIVRFAPKKNG